jgi:hypothetical protein
MRGLGLHTTVKDGHPTVNGVVLERQGSDLVGSLEFTWHANPQEDEALQFADLFGAFSSALPSLNVDAVVVRTMDHGPATRRTTELACKYGVQSLLLAVARPTVKRTARLRGIDIGTRCGTDKATVDKQAAGIVGEQLREAGAAAVAAVVWAENP